MGKLAHSSRVVSRDHDLGAPVGASPLADRAGGRAEVAQIDDQLLGPELEAVAGEVTERRQTSLWLVEKEFPSGTARETLARGWPTLLDTLAGVVGASLS